ncbi:MAG: SUMF1/EgtB/PvdO family nonheme iron enzyme [Desulfosarcina sp.]
MKPFISQVVLSSMVISCAVSTAPAGDDKTASAPDITWVRIDDPGFKGQMSKFEITNAQYARYLNDALAAGKIVVDGAAVRDKAGPYRGENYYRTDGPAFNYIDAVDGGKSRISFDGTTFAVVSGFEDHPVTFVSWYGAMAFAAWYGWRLPTEWEWQAVADYDGSYTYGCGTEINSTKANYERTIFPHGTTDVGQFGAFGYGVADMAGSVAEWTSSRWNPLYTLVVYRGGGWHCGANLCEVSRRDLLIPGAMWPNIGYRVCR